MKFHSHHIVPRFLNGTDDKSNLEIVSVKQHFDRHYQGWIDTGDIRHLWSCKLLQGILDCKLTDEELRLIASVGGKIGGRVQYEKGLGIHAYTPDERKEIASLGGKNGNFQISCIMRRGYNESDAKVVLSNEQSRRGKIGGVKNKGFVWINDGNVQIKYTLSMQQECSVDDFLIDNPTFKKGRISKIIGDIKCPHCDKIGTSYPAMMRYHFDKCKFKKGKK